jgi:hypothetical protein
MPLSSIVSVRLLDLPAFAPLVTLPPMGRVTGQWQCRICNSDRWHIVSVKRKNGSLYTNLFYACSGCSAMCPEQFNALGPTPISKCRPSFRCRRGESSDPVSGQTLRSGGEGSQRLSSAGQPALRTR